MTADPDPPLSGGDRRRPPRWAGRRGGRWEGGWGIGSAGSCPASASISVSAAGTTTTTERAAGDVFVPRRWEEEGKEGV